MDCGEDLVAIAAGLAIKISEDLDIFELERFIEFTGLLRHNMEIIKHQRFMCKKRELEKLDKCKGDKS